MRRAGKPCLTGRGSPFIPTAIIAVRPSRAFSVGKPTVKSSTERPTICVAPD